MSNACRLSGTPFLKLVSGLERLRVDDPDLLMVDYAMPGMNGLQVMEKAREFRENLPVIVATGYGLLQK